MNTKHFGEFYRSLIDLGEVSYDECKSFTQYAGILESWVGDMFCELDEVQQQMFMKRVKDKIIDIKANCG